MAHRYAATVAWSRDGASFTDNRYSRRHRWSFDGGIEVPASSSPLVVPLPHSDPSAVDPEEAFVASLSSCHMLFFLAFAAKAGIVVDAYEDEAVGTMDKNDKGREYVARVVLRPRITISGEKRPAAAEIERLHHAAHDHCFIASSVRSDVIVEALPTVFA